jgi:hypothetical protein
MKPFYSLNLVLTLTTVSVIILSFNPTTSSAASPTDQISASIEEAKNWIHASESREVQAAWKEYCNVPPSLSYLRAHLKLLLVKEDKNNGQPLLSRTRKPYNVSKELISQPLLYSFYVQNVLQPYRSRLAEANARSTSFCYLDREHEDCPDWGGCRTYRDAAVCFPYDDDWTEGGTCIPCSQLEDELKKGKTNDEVRIGYLNATCDPKTLRGPLNPVPFRYTKEPRWLRWFLESSFVFEGKKVGEDCTASTGLSKARAYLDVLMKKHFGGKTKVNGSLSLTTPGMKGEEEESLYEEVKAELSGKNSMFYEQKLNGISDSDLDKVFCSREEGLVCVEGKCRDCGDEVVKRDENAMEACHPKNAGGQDRKLMSPEFTVILGIFSTVLGSFRW